MIKLAALLLTCDLVNPYHERKGWKKKKEREHKKGLWEIEVEGRDKEGAGREAEQPHATQAIREGEERKIKLFNLVVLGESKCNNNTGNLSLSPLRTFLRAKIKKTTMKKKKYKGCCCEVSLSSLLLVWSFPPLLLSHIMANFTCHSPVQFFQLGSSTFPKAHTLLASTVAV